MMSLCYIVLPKNIDTKNFELINSFINQQIYDYYLELEVEPYKKFFPKEQVYKEMKKYGLNTEGELEQYLIKNGSDEGVENGYYYWILTCNKQWKWDYFILGKIGGVIKHFK